VIAAGRFNDHTRIAAKMVQISGTLNGSLTAAGTTVKIEPSATLAKNMLCFGENVITEGTITGDARIVAQKATIGGKIAGDVTITAQSIVILPGTVIGGDLNYTAPTELVLSPSITLSGKLNRTFEPVQPAQFFKQNLTAHFFFAFAALFTGMVFGPLFPRYTARTVHLLGTARGTCLLTGFVALFLIPILAFLLLFTLIGLPLSLLTILFYIILLYLSKVVVGLWIGTLILRRKENFETQSGRHAGCRTAGHLCTNGYYRHRRCCQHCDHNLRLRRVTSCSFKKTGADYSDTKHCQTTNNGGLSHGNRNHIGYFLTGRRLFPWSNYFICARSLGTGVGLRSLYPVKQSGRHENSAQSAGHTDRPRTDSGGQSRSGYQQRPA
jgi:cytoskeletal protein CcmA (bactofilin family)